jgi:hypothetical protein
MVSIGLPLPGISMEITPFRTLTPVAIAVAAAAESVVFPSALFVEIDPV